MRHTKFADRAELEAVLLTLSQPKRGTCESSFRNHLRDAVYDWVVEGAWEAGFYPVVEIIDGEIVGAIFYRFTDKGKRHVTLRHITTKESVRGRGIAEDLMNFMYRECFKSKVYRIRFFINPPAVPFYKKLGFRTWGVSKTGLYFVYTKVIRTGEGDWTLFNNVRNSNAKILLEGINHLRHDLEPELSKQLKRVPHQFDSLTELPDTKKRFTKEGWIDA